MSGEGGGWCGMRSAPGVCARGQELDEPTHSGGGNHLHPPQCLHTAVADGRNLSGPAPCEVMRKPG